jgi:hypothetical protein
MERTAKAAAHRHVRFKMKTILTVAFLLSVVGCMSPRLERPTLTARVVSVDPGSYRPAASSPDSDPYDAVRFHVTAPEKWSGAVLTVYFPQHPSNDMVSVSDRWFEMTIREEFLLSVNRAFLSERIKAATALHGAIDELKRIEQDESTVPVKAAPSAPSPAR